MGIQTSLGATWAISASTPATEDQAGYEALTFTEVGEVQNLGTIGATFEDVTHVPLKTGITQHRKGGIDYGSISATLAADDTDSGQVLADSGVDGAERDTVFSHKITLQNGAVRYFQGQMFSAPETVGTASDMVTKEYSVMLSTGIVKVAAP